MPDTVIMHIETAKQILEHSRYSRYVQFPPEYLETKLRRDRKRDGQSR